MSAKIIARHAEDHSEAYLIANAMENAGAEVISITFNGVVSYKWTLETHSKFVVWGKLTYRKDLSFNDQEYCVDQTIENFLKEK